MSQEQYVVDYISEFPHAILAQGKGNDFLALFRLNEALFQNGKKAHYELLHRWLREPCVDEDDQSWSLVMGTERTYLPAGHHSRQGRFPANRRASCQN